MQYALIQVLPDVPAGGVCAGIDWATADHVACVVDMAGRVRDRFSAAHDKAGLNAMITRLRRAGAREVAIERGDGVLVDALLAAGLTVVVITSRQVKNLRSRYGSSGAKDDRFDSFVLADTLRTDRARLRPLIPDTAATIALRAAVRARRNLVAHRVAACNRLRAHLAVAFPAAAGLFFELDSPISLAFLARFGCHDAVAGVGEQQMTAWLQTVPARGNAAPASVLCARLRAAAPGATGEEGAAQAAVTAALAATLTALAAQVKVLEARIAAQLASHPDAHIFTALPRAGTLRAARLLAEIGDCRSKFPDPESLAGLAGIAPVTRQSGKHASIEFRWAVNRQLRDAFCDFADGSRHASAWAAGIYAEARARGKDHPHAVRILARAWSCTIAGTAYGSGVAELDWYQGGEYVITDQAGTPVHPEWYSDEFRRLLRRAGLRRITLHDSRHTTLTLMEHAGVPISIISKWAGHYDSAFTQKTYVHASEEDLQRGQAALARIHKIA
jgi:transposase